VETVVVELELDLTQMQLPELQTLVVAVVVQETEVILGLLHPAQAAPVLSSFAT
jgi:hypothetical protein